MGIDTSEVVRRFWESIWTQGNADLLSDTLDPDMRQNGEVVDVEEFKRGVSSWRRVFPDFAATIEELIDVEPDRVVSRVTYTGTQQLTWAGLPATGRSFKVVGIDIFRVREGRVMELWHSVDHYDMAAQLGAKLVPADPGEEI